MDELADGLKLGEVFEESDGSGGKTKLEPEKM